MTNPLLSKRCIPCEGGEPSATDDEVQRLLPFVPGWTVQEHRVGQKMGTALVRTMRFMDFRSAMSFLRSVEEIAEEEGHHPDFCVHYNVVDFTLFTHAVGGLHQNDFILAARINALAT